MPSPKLAWLVTQVDHQGDECLIWPFPFRKDGYGQFKIGKRNTLAHRHMLCLATGIDDPNRDAAHNCGNRACVNPRHLRWATRKENFSDTIAHGTKLQGSKRWNSKLTEADVAEILRSPLNQCELGRRYGVDQSLINKIVKRHRWQHAG